MTKVDYIIYGENDVVIADGSCKARADAWEMQDICDHASVEMDDVWSMETTRA